MLRFLTLEYAFEGATVILMGRITFNALLIPRKVKKWTTWKEYLRYFQTPDPHTTSASEVWFWVLTEDHWIENKFGKLVQTQTYEENHGRTIFCHFSVWRCAEAQPGDEEALAADPHGWESELAEVIPPVTA